MKWGIVKRTLKGSEMTDFLIRHFVKDHGNTEDAAVRTSYGVFASVVGIVVNLLLSAVKFTIGALVSSVSVMSDAVNNLSDGLSNVIAFAGIRLASRPADDDHPFGHGRYEYVTALIVSLLIILAGLEFLKSGIEAILHPNDLRFSVVAVTVLVISLAGKLFLGLFNRNIGRRINSDVLKANAADAFGDMLITGVTIVSMLAFGLFNINIDGYAGVIVSVMIIRAGILIAKDTLQPLIGEPVTAELRGKIKRFVEGYEGVTGSHDLIVHSYGPSTFMATIHAEIPDTTDIVKGHELMDLIERDCMEKLGILLTIHMDPVSTGPEAESYRKMLSEVLRETGEGLQFHDLRFVKGQNRINLIFDILCEKRLSPPEEEVLKKTVSDKCQERDPRFACVITIDYHF